MPNGKANYTKYNEQNSGNGEHQEGEIRVIQIADPKMKKIFEMAESVAVTAPAS